ncbi:MAG: hypothetical protein JEY99_13075 [Spirochaetales bacterium]|nr:hypothetical protein [Spirochaetales bacterium]
MLSEQIDKAPQSVEIGFYRIKLLNSSETQILGGEKDSYPQGSFVIVNSKYGRDLAKILSPVETKPKGDESQKILRAATDKEVAKFKENQGREEEALRICREKVAGRGLDMKLVAAHYLLDEPKVLFFFTAESRVDFRELVKDLVAVFRMRIELRQIGVRDESRILGGLAVCGRAYCCHSITDKLRSVSIKMVKEQNLSLNSMKISGPCGRLLCCLAYEYDFYNEIKKTLPSVGTRVRLEKEEFRVRDVNVLSQKITLNSNEGRTLEIKHDQMKYSKENERWMLVNIDEGELEG